MLRLPTIGYLKMAKLHAATHTRVPGTRYSTPLKLHSRFLGAIYLDLVQFDFCSSKMLKIRSIRWLTPNTQSR